MSLKQQLHKKCGGEIILISDGEYLKICCKRCLTQWETPTLIKKDKFMINVTKKNSITKIA